MDHAQQSSIPLSQATPRCVAAELRKQQVSVRNRYSTARPLNNICHGGYRQSRFAPAATDVSQLSSPEYQQLIASGIANGIAAIRAQLGAAP